MSTITTFDKFTKLPFPALREVANNSKLDALVSLMQTDPLVDEYIRSLNMQVGGYNVFFNGRAGVEVPAKNYTYTWPGRDDEIVDKTMSAFAILMERFPGHLDTLTIDTSVLEELLEWSSFGECKRLDLSATRLATLEDDQPRINALLDSLQITEGIKFDVRNCRLNIDKICHLDEVEISDVYDWMTGDHLLKFDTKTLRIGRNDFEELDINAFLRQWQTAENPKLEMFSLEHKKNWHLPSILRGLPATEFDADKRDATYLPKGYWNPFDMSTALDIRRSDGLMASVRLTEAQLIVVVWKERFVEKKRIESAMEEVNKEIAKQQFKIERNNKWMDRKRLTAGEGPAAKRRKDDEDEVLLEENRRIEEVIAENQKKLEYLKKPPSYYR